MRWGLILLPLFLLAGCEPRQVAPRAFLFEGLPVQGSMADAQHAGLTDCTTITRTVRCRKDGVMIKGQGPYTAVADLLYEDGSGGFYQLTVWSESDQDALNAVGDALEREGWQLCRTGEEFRGDQAIYTHAGSPVRFSIDISYYGKRRLRILPELNQPKGRCW